MPQITGEHVDISRLGWALANIFSRRYNLEQYGYKITVGERPRDEGDKKAS